LASCGYLCRLGRRVRTCIRRDWRVTTGEEGMSNGATASDELVVDVRGLVKTFGSTKALDGLDLEVRKGEVHGFLGPNGAGKTTTLRILLGLARADAGVLRLLGGDPWRDVSSLHKRLAYVPGDLALWPNLTGGGELQRAFCSETILDMSRKALGSRISAARRYA